MTRLETGFFNVVVDCGIQSLEDRFKSLGEVRDKFGVLQNFHNLDDDPLGPRVMMTLSGGEAGTGRAEEEDARRSTPLPKYFDASNFVDNINLKDVYTAEGSMEFKEEAVGEEEEERESGDLLFEGKSTPELSLHGDLAHYVATLRTHPVALTGKFSVESRGSGGPWTPGGVINVISADMLHRGRIPGDDTMAHGQPDISHMYAPPHHHPHPHAGPSYSCSGDMYQEQPAGGYLATSTCSVSYLPPQNYSSVPKPSVDGTLLSIMPDYGGFYPQSCQRDLQAAFSERKSLPYPLDSLRVPPPLIPSTPSGTLRSARPLWPQMAPWLLPFQTTRASLSDPY
ncbi:hypothetical protein F7725_023722 [Dissostichus mawsoni]|uniref:Uncharacterized protein n=1 Tax=Dissostichus mawsoni TaxID=36200 RepID=A0A7J5XY21_DISMA|nr:hypothetical protein F7725_023722 [Dissostichus mawsoni]